MPETEEETPDTTGTGRPKPVIPPGGLKPPTGGDGSGSTGDGSSNPDDENDLGATEGGDIGGDEIGDKVEFDDGN